MPAPITYNRLYDGFQSYYKMDEASGTRVDSISGLNLSESGGTIGSQAAIINGGAKFTGVEYVNANYRQQDIQTRIDVNSGTAVGSVVSVQV